MENNNEKKKDRIKKRIIESQVVDQEVVTEKELKEEIKKDKVNTESKKVEFKEKSVKPIKVEIDEQPPAHFIVYIIGILLMIGLIIAMPLIYRNIENRATKSTYEAPKEKEEKEEPEDITIKSEVIKDLTYPIMRNSKYNADTYYNKDSITMADFSNNDILYNAFIHVYNGNLASYTEGYNANYCSTPDKQKMFNSKYIELRINNLFGKNTEFQFTDFIVPTTNQDTSYVGLWKYDGNGNRYVYYGDCTPTPASDIEYYDIEIPTSARGEDLNETIYVDKYVGFAKVTNSTNSYQLYSDYSLTKLVKEGTFSTDNRLEELNEVMNGNIKEFNKYEYMFSKENCSYENYCFVSGKWN